MVALANHNRVEVFDLNGTSLGYFGQSGTALGQVKHPTAVAFDPSESYMFLNRTITEFKYLRQMEQAWVHMDFSEDRITVHMVWIRLMQALF